MYLSVRFFIVLGFLVSITSCNHKKEPATFKAVEDLTGYTTIKNGEKMKEKLKDFEKLQQERLNEAENVE